jgi:hypothetical protein
MHINTFLRSKKAKLSFTRIAELSGRCNSSERKRPYSRVLYLVLFDTFLKSESVTLYSRAAKYQMLAKKSKLRYQKELENFTSEENQ